MRSALVLPFVVLLLARAMPVESAPEQANDGGMPEHTRVLDTVVVSGELPGPGLWKVSKGEHVMWVLGSLSPAPKRMVWQSQSVEAVIAQADEVLMSGSVDVSTGKSFFGNLFLVPSMLSARKNPDKETLKDVVPPELYARWLVLKKKYLGRAESVEKRRPIFAAYALYQEAIENSGLSQHRFVNKVVRKAAKRHKVPITEPTVKVKLKDPKGMIQEFKKSALDDVECFAKTLQHLESDLDTMKDRANAWATGDIALLQELSYTDQGQACVTAILENSAMQSQGLGNLLAQVKAEWIKAAEAALANNKSTFATLPMAELVEADGYLAALRSKGYRIEAPTEQDAP